MNDTLFEKLRKASEVDAAASALLETQTKRFSDGSTYVGEFWTKVPKMKLPHGRGQLCHAGGTSWYTGEWHLGQMQGQGEFVWENGDCYQGYARTYVVQLVLSFYRSFKNNELHGYGILLKASLLESNIDPVGCIYSNNLQVCTVDGKYMSQCINHCLKQVRTGWVTNSC